MDIDPGMVSLDKQLEKSFVSRFGSLTKSLSAVSRGRTRSLPVMPVACPVTSSPVEHIVVIPDIDNEVQKKIKRSYSAPLYFSGSLDQVNSVGVDRVSSSSPHPGHANGAILNNTLQSNTAVECRDTNVVEENAVCRICLEELEEGGETLRMDCSCKGELALAHQACAVEWFSIKGNKTCDVCKQDVRNLSMDLLKLHGNQTASRLQAVASQEAEAAQYRVWQDVPVLVLVNMLAYFCLLEQLLVREMGTHALALALPFSCVLGLLSSMIASIVVNRSHIWAYASIQFLIVILFAHIMYNMLKVTPVLAVLLASFIGFGITMSVNSLVMEYLTWGARQILQSARRHNPMMGQNEWSRNNNETGNEDSVAQQEAERRAPHAHIMQ